MSKTIDEIISQQNKKIPEIYIELQTSLELKYGKNVIILIEIGSFYEIYQIGNIGKAQEVSQLCNIFLTRKNKKINTIDVSNPMLCGIPSIKLDKYLDILIREEIYTIVVIKQSGSTPNITRVVDKLISPGTNIDFVSKSNKNNYISSIFLEKLENGIILGSISSIDLTSGNVYCFQSDGNEIDKLLPLDELYNHMNIYDGKEVIITLDNITSKDDLDIIKSKFDLDNKVYVIYNLEDKKKSLNIKHQNEILKSVFNINSMLSPMEYLDFDKYFNISSSLVLLIEFIIDHNNKIVYNLKTPVILNNNKQLYLGNNAIDQLEITSYGKNKGLIDILSKNLTPLGKRFINNRILNPILDKSELLRRYENSVKFINFTKNDYIKDNLSKMYDMERLERKILINSIHPFELTNFYYSLQNFMKIFKVLISDSNMRTLDILQSINIKNLIDIIKQIDNSFDLNNLCKYSLNNIDTTFVNIGVNTYIDELTTNYNSIFEDIDNLANKFIDLIDVNNTIKDKSTLVKINHNDTEGYFYTMTRNRYTLIKDELKNHTFILDNKEYNLNNDLNYKSLTGTIKIVSNELKEVSDKLITLKSKIVTETIKYYNDFINELIVYKYDLADLSIFLGELEFYLLNATLFNNHAYCIPTILDFEESFIEVKDIRHPIIERFEDRGIYITNDLVLGNKHNTNKVNSFNDFYNRKESDQLHGVMLYGLNSSGKCLDPFDKVMMYDNSTKYVKDVILGDKLMGDDGTKRNVLNITNGIDTMYEITFKNGDSFKCNGNHILCLKSCNYKSISFKKNENRYKVAWYDGFKQKSKTFMFNKISKEDAHREALSFLNSLENDYMEYTISMNDFLKLNKAIQRNFIMYKNGLEYKEDFVSIDPYLLGYWLGDGTSKNSNISTINKEVIDYIDSLDNYKIKMQGKNTITYNVVEKYNFTNLKNICPICNKMHKNKIYCSTKCQYIGVPMQKNLFMHNLKEFDLINNKHIPNVYLFNSKKIRLALLAGLLDSDGHLSKNGMYEITQKNEILANNIEQLSKSLGLYVNKRKVVKKCFNNGVCGEYYRISIGGELLKELPLKIEYKKIKKITTDINTLRNMYSFKVNCVGIGNYSGFELDGNHKFLLHDFTVTHNSSLMKSLGINLILAQAGFFVSASSFRYTLFESLFTRISGKDDIYKGLSSFAVEMVELRNIFNRVNGKSLVLGDEISHGTETISGMSIVASTVITLLKKKANFIFATHLHQLNDIEEYNSLKDVVNLHLSVKYDEENEKLIYDRKLKYGSGSSIYGLEFAKFIDLDKDFLKVANDIRKNIAKDLTNLEMIKKQKKSIYNSNVYYTKCAFCDELAIDVHHLKEQQNANENKIIDHHRMNHKYNLVPLCKKHHDIIHKYQDSNKEPLLKYIQTSNGIELEISELLKDKL